MRSGFFVYELRSLSCKLALEERAVIDNCFRRQRHINDRRAVSKGVFVDVFKLGGKNHLAKASASVKRAAFNDSKIVGETNFGKISAALKSRCTDSCQRIGERYGKY